MPTEIVIHDNIQYHTVGDVLSGDFFIREDDGRCFLKTLEIGQRDEMRTWLCVEIPRGIVHRIRHDAPVRIVRHAKIELSLQGSADV